MTFYNFGLRASNFQLPTSDFRLPTSDLQLPTNPNPMLNSLQHIFHPSHSKILIIAIGNYLRSDDGAGPRILEKLNETERIQLLNAETNIERYIEPIQQSGADVLLFIDCVHFGKEPGYTALLTIDKIEDHTMHSHNISLKRIKEFFTVPAYVLGIQPGILKVSEQMSEEVRQAVIKITLELILLISGNHTDTKSE
jgi:hydrogenase 3 maturation protease